MEVEIARHPAWELPASVELSFDFEGKKSAHPLAPSWPVEEKVGVREAIIRWLDEQL